MAASEITAQEIVRTSVGKVVTLEAANVDGNYFTNGSLRSFRISNAGGAAINLTFDIPVIHDGTPAADRVESIPNDSDVHEFGPLPSADYGEIVNVTYSSETSVTVAVTYYKEEE